MATEQDILEGWMRELEGVALGSEVPDWRTPVRDLHARLRAAADQAWAAPLYERLKVYVEALSGRAEAGQMLLPDSLQA